MDSPSLLKKVDASATTSAPVKATDPALVDLSFMDPNDQKLLRTTEMKDLSMEVAEMAKATEPDFRSLRNILASKASYATDLKNRLSGSGSNLWSHLAQDLNRSLKNIKDSSMYQSVEQSVGGLNKAVHETPVFQKTESVLKTTSEKTASVFRNISNSIDTKFSNMKNSQSLRTIEEKVGSTYETVKTKVASRSEVVSRFLRPAVAKTASDAAFTCTKTTTTTEASPPAAAIAATTTDSPN